MSPPPASPELGACPGDVVAGRWRVEEVIGKGGFGVVVRAAPLAGGRAVAIKLLRPELLSDARVVKRFLREASLVQRLEHPHTVRLIDVGQTDEGVPFLVFELLSGRPLDRVIRAEGPLRPARVARIAAQVLKALGEAHARQVVHRDLKPANIFLCEYQSDPDFVKVLDFGIGKALDASGRTVLTQAGRIVGTPNYFAPERLTGQAPDGPAADLYALGLIMAEMLSGRVVVTGPSFDAICQAHLAAGPLALAPEVEGSPLGPVIRRAVEKDPARRFGSAAEMLAALQPERATAAPAPAPPARMSRRAVIAAVALGMVAVAAAGTAVGLLVALASRPALPSWGHPELIEQRLRLGGWGFSREDTHVGEERVSMYQVGGPSGQRGVVALYDYTTRANAASAVQAWQTPVSVSVQDGTTVLVVHLGSRAESEALLAAILADRPPQAPPPTTTQPPTAPPTTTPASTQVPADSTTEAWPWLTVDFIDERLRLDGWTTRREEPTQQPSVRTWTISLRRPPAPGGAVILYRFYDPVMAAMIEGNFNEVPVNAVARDGTTLLLVNAHDRAESRRVLEFILAGRP